MLMSKDVEGVVSLAAYTPVIAAAAAKRDEEVVAMLYSDYGLDIYSNGIVFSDELLASDPDLAKSFVRALSRSCAFAVEDPARAIEIFMEYNAAANPEIARPQFDVTINHLRSEEHTSELQSLMRISYAVFCLKKKKKNMKLDKIQSNIT